MAALICFSKSPSPGRYPHPQVGVTDMFSASLSNGKISPHFGHFICSTRRACGSLLMSGLLTGVEGTDVTFFAHRTHLCVNRIFLTSTSWLFAFRTKLSRAGIV